MDNAAVATDTRERENFGSLESELGSEDFWQIIDELVHNQLKEAELAAKKALAAQRFWADRYEALLEASTPQARHDAISRLLVEFRTRLR